MDCVHVSLHWLVFCDFRCQCGKKLPETGNSSLAGRCGYVRYEFPNKAARAPWFSFTLRRCCARVKNSRM
jgi:hypothetical protein